MQRLTHGVRIPISRMSNEHRAGINLWCANNIGSQVENWEHVLPDLWLFETHDAATFFKLAWLWE